MCGGVALVFVGGMTASHAGRMRGFCVKIVDVVSVLRGVFR